MVDGTMNDEMKEIIGEFLAESQEALEGLDQRFVALEERPDDADLLNEIFRAAHSMKGSAGFLGFTRLVEVAHQAENILNKMRQQEITVERPVIDVILEAMDVIKLLLQDIRETGTDAHVDVSEMSAKLATVLHWTAQASVTPAQAALSPSSPQALSGDPSSPAVLDSHFRGNDDGGRGNGDASAGVAWQAGMTADGPGQGEGGVSQKLGAILVEDGAVSPDQLLEALAKQDDKPRLGDILVREKALTEEALDKALKKQGHKPSGADEDQTIRVETRRLDHVMNLVGELVLGRNRMMKLGAGIEQSHEADPLVRELAETLGRLDLVTTDLQSAVMRTRMLPIRKVLGKFPRMVRDLANKVGKKVTLDLAGEETELDKSVIDEIGDPLVHLVRNSIDHGLETPEERRSAGKPEHGTVRLEALQEGDRIVIRISDDGRGISLEKVKAKALARGLVTPQELSTWGRREIIHLIFQPGFSTAECVSDLSGRGVGMDVVRTNISRINGTVEVDTEEGRGSTVTITLPLTIAIIQALMVGVERQVFAVPLTSVLEAVKLGQGHLKTINGREVLTLRDAVLPLLRLSDAYGIPEQDKPRDSGYVVVVSIGERRVGIVVDRLHAQEEVVIKSLGEYLGDIQGVAGATITGEGKVVLILDVAELAAASSAWGCRGLAPFPALRVGPDPLGENGVVGESGVRRRTEECLTPSTEERS
jgi:two-component system chemotaxis sensor kinase CheA